MLPNRQADLGRPADGVTTSFTSDGPLPTSESITGPVTGTTSQTDNNDLRPITTVAGNTIPYSQNNDLVARFVYGTKSWAPDYMVKNGTTYRFVTDQLGSPRLVVDMSVVASVDASK